MPNVVPIRVAIAADRVQVHEHHDSGVQEGPALSFLLIEPSTGRPVRPDLTQEEKDALVAFLRTLEDPVPTTDPRFSDPFRK